MNYTTASERWAGVGPYYAMFPTAFVNRVVESYTDLGQQILDPFAGRASSIYAGAVRGRPSLGIEISPVGWIYGKTKLAPANLKALLDRLDEVAEAAHYQSDDVGAYLPEFFTCCFSLASLKFLLTARRCLNWRLSKVDRTLMTLILIDLHGVRERSFSNQMRQSKAMSPDYSVKWWRSRNLTPPDRDPRVFLQQKIKWRYAKGTPDVTHSDVWLGDSTVLMRRVEHEISQGKWHRIALLLTSPPYIGVTDYHRDQWLRMWMLGHEPSALRNPEQYRSDFNSAAQYRQLLSNVFAQASEIMSPSGCVYVRTDARKQTFEITRDILRAAFPKWRERIAARPFRGDTQTALYGDRSKKPGERDIILKGPRA